VKAVAILAVRNEALYIRRCIRWLLGQGVQVVVIDNESTDDTRAICAEFRADEVLGITSYPYNGHYPWRGLLQEKNRVRKQLDADWVIHQDADEILASNRPGESLHEALCRADRQGYDAVNFNEFVFIPDSPEKSYERSDYLQAMRFYYFFEPYAPRLVRAFKNCLAVDNVSSGGHAPPLEAVRLFPENMTLRHYIFLSVAHGREKYHSRVYAEEELALGWHGNRVRIRERRLVPPPVTTLERATGCLQAQLSVANPRLAHYWEWEETEPADPRQVPTGDLAQGCEGPAR
jgi:glycosyltransferase involved in cell wall biosynthesis